ncbi:MAG: EF-hand domain-containing protein [Pseudohongiella sp.]|nr:EF-hand domain-containing protein [Pseudohongiella sp.]
MDKLRLIVGLGILGLSASTMAADEKSPGDRAMTELDTDGDGRVTFVEFQAHGSEALAAMDSDGNGVLTIDEFLNGRPGPGFGDRGRRGDRGDRSGDGRPQREPSDEQAARMQEMQEMMAQRATEQFQEMDTDGDDLVSFDEFQQANFLRMDADNNGVLSAQELRPQRGGRPAAGRHGPGGPRGDRTPQV